MTVIAVFNQKGGVGKTTTTANLAAAMAKNGFNPIAIDFDPQAHLTALAGLTPDVKDTTYGFFKTRRHLTDLIQMLPNGVGLIPSHMELARLEMMLGGTKRDLHKLDKALTNEMLKADAASPVIIDCCPMLGVLSLTAILAADVILVPVTAEYLALNGANQLEQTMRGLGFKGIHRPWRVFINRYQRGNPTSERVAGELKKRYGDAFCRTRVFESQTVMEGIGHNQDVFSFAPDSEGAEDFSYLLDELIETGFIKIAK